MRASAVLLLCLVAGASAFTAPAMGGLKLRAPKTGETPLEPPAHPPQAMHPIILEFALSQGGHRRWLCR